MSNYRSDQLVQLIKMLDRRTNTEDDEMALDENTIVDLFFPISDRLSLIDVVQIAYFDPSLFVWGDGSSSQSRVEITSFESSSGGGIDFS